MSTRYPYPFFIRQIPGEFCPERIGFDDLRTVISGIIDGCLDQKAGQVFAPVSVGHKEANNCPHRLVIDPFQGW